MVIPQDHMSLIGYGKEIGEPLQIQMTSTSCKVASSYSVSEVQRERFADTEQL